MARSADPRLRQRWRKLLDSFDSNQETVGDFCRRHQVSTASFYTWRRKLNRPARRVPRRGNSARARQATPNKQKRSPRVTSVSSHLPPSEPSHVPAFLPVHVKAADAASAATLRVHLPEGASIELPVDQRELLFDLVARFCLQPADLARTAPPTAAASSSEDAS